jgi:hypothetical protein
MSCLRRKAVGWLGRKGNFWFRAILWPFHQSCTCALAFLHGPGTGTFLRPGLMLQHHYINLDCTRSQFGAGRNRYVSAAPAWNRTPGLAVQKSKSRLSVAANKSCLQGWPFKIWSCAPAPYGNGTHVCAALTGGRIIAAPFLDKNPIFIYPRSDGRETLNRRSAHHKHKIAKGSNPTGGGTAVTNPTSRTGGTELRLFHFWDLSLAPPTNRNTYRSKEPPRRMG